MSKQTELVPFMCKAPRVLSGKLLRGLVFTCVACAGTRTPNVAPGGEAISASVVTGFPSGPPAESYATGALFGAVTDSLALQLAAEVDRTERERGQPPLTHDARLDRLAYDLALLTGEMNVPASDAIAFLLSYYGLVEPEPNLILIGGEDGAEVTAVADLRRQLQSISTSSAWRRVGIGVRRGAGAWTAVLAFHEHHLDIEPIPRKLPSGGHAPVTGRVEATFRSPEVLVASPRGTVHKLAAHVQQNRFAAALECNLGDGAYQVEVSAEDARGPTVLANFPVYCGVDPPAIFSVRKSPRVRATDAAAVEREILDLLDRDRAANGLPALVRDPRLAQIARGYSREMAEAGDVAHFSRRSGNAVDRVRAAGVLPMPRVIAENVGRDYAAANAEHGFMASPGHRDNILNRALTHVGVGVAMGKQEDGAVPLFVTQLFAGWGQ